MADCFMLLFAELLNYTVVVCIINAQRTRPVVQLGRGRVARPSQRLQTHRGVGT